MPVLSRHGLWRHVSNVPPQSGDFLSCRGNTIYLDDSIIMPASALSTSSVFFGFNSPAECEVLLHLLFD